MDGNDILAKCKIFMRAFVKEKEMVRGKFSKPPSLQELKKEMEYSGAYSEMFPETFKLHNVSLAFQMELQHSSSPSVK